MKKRIQSVRHFSIHMRFSAMALASILTLSNCITAPSKSEKTSASSQTTATVPPHSTSPVDFPRGEGLETIAIVGTNDIHGELAPVNLRTREKNDARSVSYQSGGAAVMASLIRVLRSEFGVRLLWLDAGDEFQGSLESNEEEGAPMVQFFNSTKLTAAAVGNHEFDFGVAALNKRMEEAQYPYLATNIFDRRSPNKLTVLPKALPSYLTQAGNIKVGIIGLSTPMTPVRTKAENVKDLRFEYLRDATIREAATLRAQGAQMVLITAHAGVQCSPGRAKQGYAIRKPTDPLGPCGSDSGNNEMGQLLRSLPEGTVDAVISGHVHTVVHHWIAGIPVIQAGAFGRYLNVVYLTYDWNQKKVLSQNTRIEGPVPVCQKVFKNQNDCNGDRPAPRIGRGPLVSYYFHDNLIQPDPEATAVLAPSLSKADVLKSKIIGRAARLIDHYWNQESPLGNLAADAIKEAAQTDFAFINPGSMRSPFDAGPITYGAIFKTYPFENTIYILTLTRAELTVFLKIAHNGSRGFGSISGLKVKLIDPAFNAPFVDLNDNGVQESWEYDRLVELRTTDGQPLDSKKYYKLALADFLVNGGEDFGWFMANFPKERVQKTSIKIRESILNYVQASASINTDERPLVDPANPRIQFVKPNSSKRKSL